MFSVSITKLHDDLWIKKGCPPTTQVPSSTFLIRSSSFFNLRMNMPWPFEVISWRLRLVHILLVYLSPSRKEFFFPGKKPTAQHSHFLAPCSTISFGGASKVLFGVFLGRGRKHSNFEIIFFLWKSLLQGFIVTTWVLPWFETLVSNLSRLLPPRGEKGRLADSKYHENG